MDLDSIARRVAGKIPVDEEDVLGANDQVISSAIARIKQKLDSLARREAKSDLPDALKRFNEIIVELNKIINAIVKGHAEVRKPAQKVMDRMNKLHDAIRPLRSNIEKGL